MFEEWFGDNSQDEEISFYEQHKVANQWSLKSKNSKSSINTGLDYLKNHERTNDTGESQYVNESAIKKET